MGKKYNDRLLMLHIYGELTHKLAPVMAITRLFENQGGLTRLYG